MMSMLLERSKQSDSWKSRKYPKYRRYLWARQDQILTQAPFRPIPQNTPARNQKRADDDAPDSEVHVQQCG